MSLSSFAEYALYFALPSVAMISPTFFISSSSNTAAIAIAAGTWLPHLLWLLHAVLHSSNYMPEHPVFSREQHRILTGKPSPEASSVIPVFLLFSCFCSFFSVIFHFRSSCLYNLIIIQQVLTKPQHSPLLLHYVFCISSLYFVGDFPVCFLNASEK